MLKACISRPNVICWKVAVGITTLRRAIGTLLETRDMTAKVTHLNSSLGYYSATTERNKVVFTLVEPATVKIGDILKGDVENRGVRSLENETRNVQLKVDIKELHSLDAPFKGHG